MTPRPAVFLDRDGTLMEEVHYCADPALVRLFPGTAAALRRLVEAGFLCVIITNQSGIGRGLLTEAQYHAVQAELLRQLEEQEKEDQEIRKSGTGKEHANSPSLNSQLSTLNPQLITASYFCPDAPPTPSSRRKPETGMVMEAVRDLGIDLSRSWFVGDKAADIACGAHAGTRTILVQTGYGAKEPGAAPGVSPNFVAKEIVAAVEVILQNQDAKSS